MKVRNANKRLRLAAAAVAVITAITPALAQETLTYTYDARGRLVSVNHGTGPNAGAVSSYSYDAADNRSNVVVSLSGGGTTCTGVSFAASNDPAGNEGTALNFTITKAGTTTDTCTVKYQTANGTAIAGTNYTSKPLTTLTFLPSDVSKTVPVTTIDDGAVTGDLTMYLNLSAPGGVATITDNQGMGTIHNIDSTPTCSGVSFTISNGGAVTEGANSAFTVTKTGSTSNSCTVNYATANGTATAGSDYTATSGTLTFTSAQTSQIVNVPTIDDSVVESAETFTMALSSPGGGATVGTPGTATATINDNDSSGPSFSVNDVLASEGGTLIFTVTKTGSTSSTTTVNYATAPDTATSGSDYTPTSGTLTFAPTDTTKTVSVVTVQDTLVENDETLFVNLSGATGATISDPQGLGTIIDDDGLFMMSPPGDPTDSSTSSSTDSAGSTTPTDDSTTSPQPQ